MKYLCIDSEKYSNGNTHIVAFRYADVLLSLADIENELNGPTDKALGYLKQITDRVGVTHTIPADIQSSKEKFKEFLLMERGRELFMEGWRRQIKSLPEIAEVQQPRTKWYCSPFHRR